MFYLIVIFSSINSTYFKILVKTHQIIFSKPSESGFKPNTESIITFQTFFVKLPTPTLQKHFLRLKSRHQIPHLSSNSIDYNLTSQRQSRKQRNFASLAKIQIYLSPFSRLQVHLLPNMGILNRDTMYYKDTISSQTTIAITILVGNTNNNNDTENSEYNGYSGKATSIISFNGIINLSSYDLTQAQISVLSKGLNFCPTPGNLNVWDIKTDLERLHRSLRIKHVFSKPLPAHAAGTQSTSQVSLQATTPGSQTVSQGTPNPVGFTTIPAPDGVPQRLFRSTSTWNPKQAHKNIETFATVNLANLNKVTEFKPKFHNLTKIEKDAIFQLKQNKQIIIKPADKGAGVVILNLKDYIFEAKKQLYSHSYTESNKDFIEHANKEVAVVLHNMLMAGEIDKRRHTYLLCMSPKPGKFYLLPKIHKNVLPPPGRPIVSQIGSPTEKISGYLDFFLQPLL